MIDRAMFERVKQRHASYASWAVWADASSTPKSNIGDMRVLDPETNPSLLQVLRNDVVMVGLNISRSFFEPFRNFHDPSPEANDFKIRYAFSGTAFYGAYMTDIVKQVEMVESASLMRHLREAPSVVGRSVENFLQELEDLRCVGPTILAFGAAAHALVARNVPRSAYARLVKLTHYSTRMSKEKYKQTVLGQVGE